MPGARLQKFREGDIGEAFVESMLKRIAFVAPVPREEDVGHDFVCSLSEADGELAIAGPTFTVQTKSSHDPIIYSRQHAVTWITNQENPFFIVVANHKRESMEIYSTWNRVNAFLKRVAPRVRLIPSLPRSKDFIHRTRSGLRLDIYLGRPILKFTVRDLRIDSKAVLYSSILRKWIEIDRENIVRIASKMYWVKGPENYSTNKLPKISKRKRLYFHSKNLGDCRDNLFEASFALQSVLNKCDILNVDLELLEQDLPRFLEAHQSAFPERQRKAIKRLVRSLESGSLP